MNELVVKAVKYYMARGGRILNGIASLRHIIANLEGMLREAMSGEIHLKQAMISTPSINNLGNSNELPSFMRNNPRIEIFSKRGGSKSTHSERHLS